MEMRNTESTKNKNISPGFIIILSAIVLHISFFRNAFLKN